MKKITRTFLVICVLAMMGGCGGDAGSGREVVVYCSVDDVFARPIAERFQSETGIVVKLVPDTEETKSTGLLNRLIAEKNRPQADVFWSGDPVRAAILKRKEVSAPFRPGDPADGGGLFSDADGHWSALSARVIIFNRDLVSAGEEPRSLDDFLDPRWKAKACIANPLFGTTSMHAAALFSAWGEEKARAFFEGLKSNEVAMLSSNGEVKRRVAAGDYVFGLTDTDDASVAVKEGKPVAIVFPDAGGMGTLIMPNAAVLIAGGPNAENGRKFIDYLLTPAVEQALAESEAAQMPLRPAVPVPQGVKRVDEIDAMPVDYAELGDLLEKLSQGYLKQWVDESMSR